MGKPIVCTALHFSHTRTGDNTVLIRPEGLDLSKTKYLLVKFYFTNPAHVPDGVRHIARKSESDLVNQRIAALRAATPAVTRGAQVVDNALNTSADELFAGLYDAGFEIVDIQSWEQAKAGKTTKYVVNFVWARPQEGVEPIEVDTAPFTENVVWFNHIWENPTQVNTIDYVGRQPGQKAKHKTVVEDNHVHVRAA